MARAWSASNAGPAAGVTPTPHRGERVDHASGRVRGVRVFGVVGFQTGREGGEDPRVVQCLGHELVGRGGGCVVFQRSGFLSG